MNDKIFRLVVCSVAAGIMEIAYDLVVGLEGGSGSGSVRIYMRKPGGTGTIDQSKPQTRLVTCQISSVVSLRRVDMI